jgi:hypothetical protein
VARSLLEHETIDGPEVGRLLEIARVPGPVTDDAAVDVDEAPSGAAIADTGANAATDATADDMAAATRNDVPGY